MAGDDPIKIVNYAFAGLSMMLNIRLVYSASPYALLRFKLPENLFSVFVRVMASSLELWCLPSMVIGNIIDVVDKYIHEPHEQRQYDDAPKYDVTSDGNLGDRLKLKADELEIAATTLQYKANNEGVGGQLAGHAQNLASEAEKLATSNSGQASANADSVIDKYKLLEDEYNKPENKTNQAKVKSEFEAVKEIYDQILNVKKAKKLQEEVGNGESDNKILHEAKELYGKASLLARADGLRADDKKELRELAEALRDAVGNTNEALRGALKALEGASGDPRDLITKAQAVIEKYNAVDNAYKAVKAKEAAYKEAPANSQQPYTDVTSKFTALQTAYNLGKCKAITPIFDKSMIRYISIFWTWSNFATFVILFFVFIPGDQGHVTAFYWVIAASGFVFGINMVMVYAMEYEYFPWYIAGENSFPIITSFMHYVSTLMFGNRRRYSSDYIVVLVDMVISMCIAFIAAALWTYCYINPSTHSYFGPGSINPAIVSPVLMVLIGMGLVYTIYPAIAPGMIVPFYLIDKIEMVLLILTTFPPLIFATLRKLYGFGNPKQPMCEWTTSWGGDGTHWHAFDILMPLQISLAFTFIYSLHYRDSNISRSIINQPKMSTFLSIVFYMCHEVMLALGFPGMIGNNGGDMVMLPIQLIGAFLMVLLAFYSIGYITEYKRHDPSQWPTDGMTRWNQFCYWLKMASKITNKNFKQLFTTYLRREIYLFILYKVIYNMKL